MTDSFSVLITSFGSSNARALANILQVRFPNFRVLGVDCNEMDMLTPHPFINEISQVPIASDPSYIKELLKICTSEKINFLIPVHDDEVIKVAENLQTLNHNNIQTFIAPLETLLICRDKFSFYNFGVRHHLPMIQSSLNPAFTYPMFVKPRKGNGSKNCYKINNLKEAEVFSSRIEEAIFQVFEEGQVMDVDFIADAQSIVRVAVIKEEMVTKNGIGVKIRICENPEIITLLNTLILNLKFVGIGAVEFFLNKGNIKIIEVNIRPSSGIIFSFLGGGDLLGQFFNAAGLTNIKPLPSLIRYGTRLNRELVAFEVKQSNSN